jgi:hypothetical protein
VPFGCCLRKSQSRSRGVPRESLNTPENLPKEAPRQGALGQLEHEVPRMPDQPPAGLEQPLLETRQGPALDGDGQTSRRSRLPRLQEPRGARRVPDVAAPKKDAIDPTDGPEGASERREVDRRRSVGKAGQSSAMTVSGDVQGATTAMW